MRFSVLILLVFTAFLGAGCGDDAKKAAKTVNEAVSAPVNYLDTAVKAQKQAEKVIDVSYLNQAVQMFNVQEGRFPKSLDELVPNYVGKLPPVPYGYKLSYDPATGTVKVVKQ